MAHAGRKTSAGTKQRQTTGAGQGSATQDRGAPELKIQKPWAARWVDLAVDPLGILFGHGKTDKELLPERQVVSVSLLKAIFGGEKIERLLGAVYFSRGGAIRRHAPHFHMRRLGLLLVLLFLQSLFIAIDYLPVTLEVFGRDHACTYIHEPHDLPTQQSVR